MVMELLQARDAQGYMLRLWTGDGSSIQADRGQTHLLQGLFPEAPGIERPILEAFFGRLVSRRRSHPASGSYAEKITTRPSSGLFVRRAWSFSPSGAWRKSD